MSFHLESRHYFDSRSPEPHITINSSKNWARAGSLPRKCSPLAKIYCHVRSGLYLLFAKTFCRGWKWPITSSYAMSQEPARVVPISVHFIFSIYDAEFLQRNSIKRASITLLHSIHIYFKISLYLQQSIVINFPLLDM